MKRTTATILALITLTAAAAQAASTTVTLSGGEKIVINYTGTLQGVKLVGGNETLVSIETKGAPATPATPATLVKHSEKQKIVTDSEQQSAETAPTQATADSDQKSIKWSWAKPKVED